MNDDVQKYIYRALTIFVVGVLVWVGFIFINACGFSLACKQGAALVERTPIPTLLPATMPASQRFIPTPTMFPTLTVAEAATQTAGEGSNIARPSNLGGPGEAVNLTGDAATGAKIFASNCISCHGEKGIGGIPNPGSTDGTVPALNPIDSTLIDPDYKTYATNLDLFLQHGSTPAGTSPVFRMPAWGESGTLAQQQIADVIAYLISLNPAPVAATTATQTAPDIARPSNPGGPGEAVSLTGSASAGEQLFAANCVACHNAKGVGGIPNSGSTDGTVPALNPIDPTLKDPTYKTYATNLDLFIQHGSTPAGTNSTFQMPAWGDLGLLKQQQIADIIAYLISLNP
jgi:mono/diheme cytochrome c family protein